MLYTELTINENTYKLRLNTRSLITLEKRIGCNPLMIFGATGDVVPTITTMVDILFVALQEYQHGIGLEDAYKIFDSYLDAGNSASDFIFVIMEIYKASGLIGNKTEKN